MEPGTSESWNWWCHGAPGIALAFLSLYRATGDNLYAGTARACLRTIPADFRAPNLSLCHGVSGLGDILLEGHAVLGDQVFFDRAMELANATADLARPAGNGVAWHVESLYALEPDLMTGAAGIVHFLARAASEQSRHFGMPLQLPADAIAGRA
jgi:lantibiotic modifying enzyme